MHAGDLQSPRWLFQAVALPNGSALAIGGLSIAKGGVLNSTEMFIPAKDNSLQGSWSEVAAMNTPRQDFGAVLLNDGTVLAVGGFMASTEIYDPAKVDFCSLTLNDGSCSQVSLMQYFQVPASIFSELSRNLQPNIRL